MTGQEYWLLALGLFAAVVVVVAVLLGWIIAEARKIDRHAEQIWVVGKEIAASTVAIWMLDQTNRHLRHIGDAAGSLEREVASLARGLAPPDRGAGEARP